MGSQPIPLYSSLLEEIIFGKKKCFEQKSLGSRHWSHGDDFNEDGRLVSEVKLCQKMVRWKMGAIPNFATEKDQKRNFLDFTDVTLVVVDIKSERFVKSTCLQQDLFDMTRVTIMFDTKTSESESFIDRLIEGIINIMMEFHHF